MKKSYEQRFRSLIFHQNNYLAKIGGPQALRENDGTYNKLTVLIAKAYAKAHPKAFVGNLLISGNHSNPAEGNAPATQAYQGEYAFPHFADFVVPVEQDATLEDLLRQYKDTWQKPGPDIIDLVRKITVRIYELGGELLLWA